MTLVAVERWEGAPGPVLQVEGDFDFAATEIVRLTAISAVRPTDRGLVVDLGAVSFLDSAGIHLLVQLAGTLDAHRQRLRVAVPPASTLASALSIAAVEQIVGVDPDVRAALAALEAPG